MARAKDFGYYGINTKHQAIRLLSDAYGDRLECLSTEDKVNFISAIAFELNGLNDDVDIEVAEEILDRFSELDEEDILAFLDALIKKHYGKQNKPLGYYSLSTKKPLISDIAYVWGDCLEYAKGYELSEVLQEAFQWFQEEQPFGIDSIETLDDDSLVGLALMISDTL